MAFGCGGGRRNHFKEVCFSEEGRGSAGLGGRRSVSDTEPPPAGQPANSPQTQSNQGKGWEHRPGPST